MQMLDIPFGTTDWSKVERTEYRGESGLAYWRTQQTAKEQRYGTPGNTPQLARCR